MPQPAKALAAARGPQERMDAVLEAFDSLRVAITVFDADDRLVYCNRHFNYLFRAMPAREALLGNTYGDLVRLEVEKGEIARSEMLEGLEGFVARRHAQLHGGNYKPLDIRLADGRVVEIKARRAARGFVALWTDVTDLRRLASQSAHSEEQTSAFLLDLVKRLDLDDGDNASFNLLRTMSHELKTPLNAIIGFADLLGTSPERYTPAQVAEYAGIILTGGQTLLRLINQILDLTRIAAGRFSLERAGVDAGGVLGAMRDSFDERAQAKSIDLVMDDTGSGMTVHADENALRTMVGHLIENAVTFTQPGGEVMLSLSRAGGRIRIIVADNGPGVSEADLSRIARPFEQAGAQGGTKGSGLGLTLVKALAELHGGSLELASALGEGFTATLELPAA